MRNKVESPHRTLEKRREPWKRTINITNSKEEEIRINLLVSYFRGHVHTYIFMFKPKSGRSITEMVREGREGRQ